LRVEVIVLTVDELERLFFEELDRCIAEVRGGCEYKGRLANCAAKKLERRGIMVGERYRRRFLKRWVGERGCEERWNEVCCKVSGEA